MLDTVFEEARSIPVVGSYDVVVAGGGIAGVAAALAAARAGSTVCLLEKACALGGLATIGNVVYFLPLCDGFGRQICGGVCEELLQLSVEDVHEPLPAILLEPIPDAWRKHGSLEEKIKKRYLAVFNPASFAYKLERLLVKNKVKLYFDTRFAAVRKEGERISELLIENKSGRGALRCKAVVDATGDADVCAAAGEKTVSLSSNVRCGWYYYLEDGQLRLSCLSKPRDKYGRRVPSSGRNFRGDQADQVTAMLLASRQLAMQELADKAANSKATFFPIMMPQIPCFRMTRRLNGKRVLRESDDRRWFENTLGMTGDWRKPGPVFCLPLEILAAVRTPNLIAAGRCISSAGSAWDMTRAIPTCAVTGQAAGTAAAFLALDQLPSFQELDVRTTQKYLQKKKVIINRKLLLN
jgi:2-polyprenyl-6-methoxyphenol hydroxylase-like FAD-dependent oxidoreductase